MAARRGTFGFDLSRPKKKGMLSKQGQYHRAFKTRFFVLYPGFLVYYSEETRWKLDVTRGETLEGRQGAIKLRNGTVNICRQAPKGVKFGIIVHGPDPQNKRPTFLLNATSKDEREAWIEAIKNNIPHSPKTARKEDTKPKDCVTSTQETERTRPKYINRQDTVDTAAVLVAGAADDDDNELITSIDEELSEPSISIRRDTSNIAALSLSNKADSTMDQLVEEDEPVTNINDILGMAGTSNSSTDEEDIPNGTENNSSKPKEPGLEELETTDLVPVAQDLESNTESNSSPMDSQENVSSSVNVNGDVEVTVSVSVTCSKRSEIGDSKTAEDLAHTPCNEEIHSDNEKPQKVSDNEAANSEEKKQNDLEHDKKDSLASESSEVFVSKEEHSNSFSVSMVGSSQCDKDSNDESEDESTTFSSPPGSLSNKPQENGSVSSEPQENLSVSNGTSTDLTSPTTPSITINTVEKVEHNGTDHSGSEHSSGDEGNKLPPPGQQRRRSSAPFIQKVGYLYKMGGHYKNWKLRYFILNPGGFNYFKTPTSKQPLGEVKLKNTNVYFPAVGERKTSYQFCVHTESNWNKRSDWVMAAQSEREMKEWISAFKLAGQKSWSPSSSPMGSDDDDAV